MPRSPSDTAARIAQGVEHKQAGNALYSQKDYKGALREYYYAVLHLSGLDSSALSGVAPRPEVASTDLREGQRHLSQVRSNMAACFLALARYDRAAEVCDQALAGDATNAKAIFRKAQALRLRGDVYAARDWLARPAHAKYLDDADFLAEKARIDTQIRTRERSSATQWRGFLT
ncbi:Uncharacterized protein MSYG_1565 [Malassezia sympodialis ATCC 42132]|uniref:Uncharacterized protein n=1 Tax=Malassezia sympodialis (strain ATCC 42132) TaxID=1230383 RepID=A0A1M8A4W2_MALS4|nr:Uncharacterized protein MSYG_1565 [Malassezia sympodialis ATCC 42132]